MTRAGWRMTMANWTRSPSRTRSASTSPKAEFPAVVIPIAMQQYMLLERNLIYTGITRGKRLVVLVGEGKALWVAIRRNNTRLRHSGLRHRLAEQMVAT
jgi:exodeoxyribonuclease V alpha subunit